MEIGDWKSTKDLNDVYGEARELGLETNLAELEVYGFTVVENAISDDLTDRAVEAILRVTGARARGFDGPRQECAAGSDGRDLDNVRSLHRCPAVHRANR